MSSGFRKALLEKAALRGQVKLQAEPRRLVVTAAKSLRAGWADAARRMRTAGDDQLLDPPRSSAFDDREWKW